MLASIYEYWHCFIATYENICIFSIFLRCLFPLTVLSASHAVPSFAEPVFHRIREEIDSTNDDVLPGCSALFGVSGSSVVDGFSTRLGRSAISNVVPDVGLSAWVPMSADDFYASRSSIRSVRRSSQLPSELLSTSCDFESQRVTDFGPSGDNVSDSDSLEAHDPAISNRVRFSLPLTPTANFLDYISRGISNILLLLFFFQNLL